MWRSIGAVLAGLLAVVVLSTAVDTILHVTRVYPPLGAREPMSNALWLLATAYRVVFGIAGGYIAARLAPDRPVKHAVVLGVVGVVISIMGVAATWGKGPEFGPVWYPIGLVLIALPTSWLGGVLYTRGPAST
jgi:hypothetical protein